VNAVELFSGAGGLALGVAKAGFRHVAVIESDPFACQTLRENQRHHRRLIRSWPVHEIDVCKFDYSQIPEPVDLLSAGVPCQPFSIAGKGRAHLDKRDMFAEVVRAVRALRPKAVLIENVPGLRRSKFKDYFEYLVLALGTPELARDPSQTWKEHLQSLRMKSGIPGLGEPLRYDVNVHVVNAADYGVPQSRERVIIVAFRSDLHVRWRFPKPTHSLDALAWAQRRSASYWTRHGLNRSRPGKVSCRMASAISKIRRMEREPELLPWTSVRDALKGLPKLRRHASPLSPANHYLNPGARSYEGHTGSLLDEPAKTRLG
jgi:DNA (cytosine-5)-methyltransferase 1